MEFRAVQRFAAPPEEVVRLYADPAVRAGLGAIGKLSAPELVEHVADDDGVVLRLRYRYVGDLPGGAGRFIRPDRLTWVQSSRFRLAEGLEQIRIEPDHYPDRLRADVEARVRGGTPTTREVEGRLRVSLPLVGGRVERAIVDGLREHLELEAALIAARLRGD